MGKLNVIEATVIDEKEFAKRLAGKPKLLCPNCYNQAFDQELQKCRDCGFKVPEGMRYTCI